MASEVLKVAHQVVTNSEMVLINGVSGHTYTVLSITICETAGDAETFNLYLMDDGGGTDNYIYFEQALGSKETFEHTGRIVLEGTDELGFLTASASNCDVTVTYLDQTL